MLDLMPLESFMGSETFENIERTLCCIRLAESCFSSTQCFPIPFYRKKTTTEPTDGIQVRIRL